MAITEWTTLSLRRFILEIRLRFKIFWLISILLISKSVFASNFGGLAELLLIFVVGTVLFLSIAINIIKKSEAEKWQKWALFLVCFGIPETILVLFIGSH